MICTTVKCDDCREKFDIEFDATRIVRKHESKHVYLEDAEWERAANRYFGRCPACCTNIPLNFLCGPMADAIEDQGIEWLEEELKYQAAARWAGVNSPCAATSSAPEVGESTSVQPVGTTRGGGALPPFGTSAPPEEDA